jgi:hypothetical protein
MALTIDSAETFGPGPHTVIDGGLDKAHVEGRFPGLAGTKILSMRGDRREITISGVLAASGSSASAANSAMAAIVTAVDALVLDANHTIVDAFGRTWPGCCMLSWQQSGQHKGPTPSNAGSTTMWYVEQPYTARWIQNDMSPPQS